MDLSSGGFKLFAVGVVALVLGGGLTLWSYTNRDPVSGQFAVWYGPIIGGGVSVVAGWVWMSQENEPL
jgi:hypothetical protein